MGDLPKGAYHTRRRDRVKSRDERRVAPVVEAERDPPFGGGRRVTFRVVPYDSLASNLLCLTRPVNEFELTGDAHFRGVRRRRPGCQGNPSQGLGLTAPRATRAHHAYSDLFR